MFNEESKKLTKQILGTIGYVGGTTLFAVCGILMANSLNCGKILKGLITIGAIGVSYAAGETAKEGMEISVDELYKIIYKLKNKKESSTIPTQSVEA